ncbi:MAG: adenylate kinase [Myxococcota bacterium]|nr:adenylate kinase [Myxococcota bacterium]MDW8363228.1 adenylate kinase [Myxococcales bacterium]
MDVVLFGPPGAGKGTQARLLAARLGVPQIATGDMMRAERASGSELGRRFDAYMGRGLLVPDELVLELLEERLRRPDARAGAIFDGFPRTVAQAEALDALLARLGRRLAAVVSLDVGLDAIVERAAGRRVCEACGQTYHVRYNPPPSTGRCGACGADRLVRRDDDAEPVVRRRYEEYVAKTEPVLAYYEARGLLRRVDGTGSVDVVTRSIGEVIDAVRSAR